MTDNVLLATPSFRPKGLRLADPADAGGKGTGLLRLPPEWYPPTLVLSPKFHAAFVEGQVPGVFLSQGVRHTFHEELLRELAGSGRNGALLIRSSASGEGMDERGRFESLVSQSSCVDVEKIVLSMWQKVEATAKLGFILQPHIQAKVRGHLSNEHRVSRDSTSWVSEVFVGSQVETKTWRVTSAKAAAEGQLTALVLKDIEVVLRRVAKYFSAQPFRHHLEWVWDGERIWIVQADRVPPLVGPAPGDASASGRGRAVSDDQLDVWTRVGEHNIDFFSDWHKVAAIHEFHRADLPIGTIWVLQGHELITRLSQGLEVSGLDADLGILASGAVVVRTDVRKGGEKLMLPKTDTVTEPDDILVFLARTSRDLLDGGAEAGDIAFLMHRYIRARACAFTLASPGDPWVEVDSTWGLPDGLSWLPHDSAWVNVQTQEVTRSVEGKTSFLDVDSENNWTYRESPTEWIWRASMSEDQLRTISAGAHRLARIANKPVLTMWFIGILDGGDAEYLPWFQQEPADNAFEGEKQLSPSTQRTSVKAEADLVALEAGAERTIPKVISLHPLASLVRDGEFLERVATFARMYDIPVELRGSRLAHPYYMLKRMGVSVSCDGDVRQPSTNYNKLVRDNMVSRILDTGEKVISYRARATERTRRLRWKLIEESLELVKSGSMFEAVDEFADVEEVLDALRVALGLTRDQVRDRRREKRSLRGGFSRGLVLVRSGRRPSMTNDNELDGIYGDIVEYLPDQVQQRGERLTLSLIPPLPGEQHSFLLEINGSQFHVEYADSSVDITIVTDSHDQATDELTLF